MFIVFAVLSYLGFLADGVPLDTETPSGRIHGGVDAPPGFAPHMAALLAGEPRSYVICGGSIVTRKHVLTAAHCVTPFVKNDQLDRSFQARVGSNIWHSGGILVQVRSYYIHPKWDEEIMKYDAAILLLDKELDFSDTVAMIGLEFGWVGGDEPTYVTGWGTTWPRFDDNAVHLAPTPDNLQLLYARTLTSQQCNESIQSYSEWVSLAPPLDGKLEICTFHSLGHGMCHGDSGSALVSTWSYKQIGIVSWGMSCAVGAADFFTRLRAIKDFLRPILKTCPSFKS